ncbi:MAG: PAS domain-containing protein, partial [Pseudomonadota bacterium]
MRVDRTKTTEADVKDCNLIQDRNTIAQETVRSVNAIEAHLAGAGPTDGPERKASPGTDCCFQHAPLGMVIIGKDGSFEYINPKFTEMFGYGLDEIPDGKTWFRKAYPDARYRHEVIGAWIREATEAGMSEPASRIYTVGCKNGENKTIRFRPVQIGAGRYLMTCEDITELTEAAEALRNEKAKFEVLAENFPLGVVMIAEDGTYEYINPKFTQMFGYDL